ncbi:MAG TPA: pyridoxal phosphate-dependent aminotransferase [Candidatus Baltobacteraceae bacterium]|nr:pyridoxal phosphate-dependent aminotransferase [Candidatus Baltobacteraceae bacterium]
MNPRVNEISASLIREIAARRKPGSIDLGLGEPSLMPEAAHLRAGMTFALERGLRYTANAGDPELRAAIARHYAYRGLEDAENVCVTTGSQEATYATIKALLDPAKDELLVVEPAFPSYAKMAALEGVAVQRVSLAEADGFAFDAQRIAAALTPRTRMIVICSPCNPTARVITNEQMLALAGVLQQRDGEPVWILHDEIYREQTFVQNAGYFASVYPHTIVTNSVSKSNALTGLRLGWALGPKEAIAAIVKVHAWLTSCADTFSQQTVLHVFKENALREHAGWYQTRACEITDVLRESGMRHIAPDGSFYACVRLPQGANSLQAALDLADRYDTIAIPGSAFGASFEGWLRLSWVSSSEQFREGVQRIKDYAAAS